MIKSYLSSMIFCLFLCNILCASVLSPLNSQLYSGVTLLRTAKPKNNLASLSFINSSSTISSVHLVQEDEHYIVSISSKSDVILDQCTLDNSGKLFIPFLNDGKFDMKRFKILGIGKFQDNKIITLVQNGNEGNHNKMTSQVTMMSSDICNIEIMDSEGTFVSSGSSESQRILGSLFNNVSTSTDSIQSTIHVKNNNLGSSISECLFGDSIMQDCEDFFYGRIISGNSYKTEKSFICYNSTFSNCVRTHTPPSFRQSNTDITSVSGRESHYDTDYLYKECTFQNIHTTTDTYGGALYLSSNNDNGGRSFTGNVTKCTFSSCWGKNSNTEGSGGAIYMSKLWNAYITNTSFTDCEVAHNEEAHATDSDGGGIFISDNHYFHMRFCTFTRCYAGHYGGGAYLQTLDMTNGDGTGALYYCTFTDCYANHTYYDNGNKGTWGAGGGFYYNNNAAFQVNTCSFIRCKAAAIGGGFWYESPQCPKYEKGLITDTIFKNNVATEVKYSDYYVKVPNGCNYEKWVTILSTVYVSSDGTDNEQCGEEASPCKTVYQAYSNKKASSTDEKKIDVIMVKTDVARGTDGIDIQDYAVSFSKNSDSMKLCVASQTGSSAASFTVSSGSLTMKVFTIEVQVALSTNLFALTGAGTIELNTMTIQSSDSVIVTASMLNIQAGSLSCTGTKFTSFKTSTPFVTLAVGKPTFAFTSTSFVSIIRTTEGGAVIDLDSLTTSLDLSKWSFSGCGAETGTGAAVRVVIGDNGAVMTDTQTFPTSSNSWTKKNYAIMFKSADYTHIKAATTSIQTEFGTALTNANEHKYYAEITTTPKWTGSLSHLLQPPTKKTSDVENIYYVSETEYASGTYTSCGWQDFPCDTLSGGLKLVTSNSIGKTISITEGKGYTSSTIQSEIKVPVTIAGEYNSGYKTIITQNQPALFKINDIESGSTVSIKQLSITVSATGGLFVSNSGSGTVELNTVEIKSTKGVEISGSIITSSTGKVSLVSVNVDTFTLTQTALITINGGGLNIDGSTFSDITLSASPLIQLPNTVSASSITFGATKTTFGTVTRKTGNGAVFVVNVGGTGNGINLANLEFTKCVCEKDEDKTSDAKAGAVYITLTGNDGLLTIDESVTFTKPDGGWINAKTSAITFATDSAAYLLAERYKLSASDGNLLASFASTWDSTTEHMYYTHIKKPAVYSVPLVYVFKSPVAKQNDVGTLYISVPGINVPGCGWEELPCLTFESASNNIVFSDSKNKQLILIDGTYSTGANLQYEIPKTFTVKELTLVLSSKSETTEAVKLTPIDNLFTIGADNLDATIKCMTIDDPKQSFLVNSGGSTVTIDSVEFRTTTQGSSTLIPEGSLIVCTSGTVVLSKVKASSITLTKAALVSVRSGGSLTVTDSEFTSISGGNGGVFNALVAGTGSFEVTTTKFKECSSATNGGAIYLTISSGTGEVLIGNTKDRAKSGAETKFTDCSAINSGGAIYFEAANIERVTFFDPAITYERKDAASALESKKAGYYVYYQTRSDLAYLTLNTASEWKDNLQQTADYAFQVMQPHQKNAINWKDINDAGRNSYYVKNNGGTDCTDQENGCRYLSLAITAANSAPGLITIVNANAADAIVEETEEHGTDRFQIKHSYTIAGQVSASQNGIKVGASSIPSAATGSTTIFHIEAEKSLSITTITISITGALSNSLFTNAGTLDLSDVVIEGTTTEVSKSLIINTGSLQLSLTEFKSLKMTDTPLLASTLTSPASLQFVSLVKFTEIKAHSNKAAVLEATIEGDTALDLSSATFEQCGTYENEVDAVGYAVKLTINAVSNLFIPGGTFSLGDDEKVFDKKCYGLYLDVKAKDYTVPNLLSNYITEKDNTIWRKYEYAHLLSIYSETIPLSHYHYSPALEAADTAFTFDKSKRYAEGAAFSNCGWKDLPCETVQKAYDLMRPAQTLTYGTASDYTKDHVVASLQKSVTFAGEEKGTTIITITPDSQLTDPIVTVAPLSTAPVAAEFTKFTLNVQNNADDQFAKPLFRAISHDAYATAKLTLSDLTIKGTAPAGSRANENAKPLTAPLVDARSGILELKNVEFKGITLQKDPLITATLTAAAFKMEGTNTFTSITRKEGDGAILQETLTTGSKATIVGTFQGCVSSKGYGLLVFTIEQNAPPNSLDVSEAKFRDTDGKDIETFKDENLEGHAAPLGFYATKLSNFIQDSYMNLQDQFKDYKEDKTRMKYFAQVTVDGPVLPLQYYLDGPSGTEFFIKQNGVDGDLVPTCGADYLPCNAVKDAYKHVKSDEPANLNLLGSDQYVNKQIKVELLYSVTLRPKQGDTVQFVISPINDGALIAITQHGSTKLAVTLSTLSFVSKDPEGLGTPLLSVSGGSLTIDGCSINGNTVDGTGPSVLARVNQALRSTDANVMEHCSWTESVLQISDSTEVTIKDTTFANMTNGALKISNCAKVTFDKPLFETNIPLSSLNQQYPSFSRNVLCDGSTVKIINTDRDSVSKLWIISDSCTFEGDVISESNAYFEPTLTNAVDTANTEAKSVKIEYTGDVLVPCNLYWNVLVDETTIIQEEVDDSGNDQGFSVTLTGADYTAYDEGTDVRTWLSYGPDPNNQNRTSPISLKRGGAQSSQPSESSFPTYAIVIIAVVGFLLLLLLLLLLICCLCCRKKDEDEENEELMVAKDDTDAMKAAPIAATIPTTNTINTSMMVEGIEVKEPHNRVLAEVKSSLFSRIHRESERQARNPFAWAAEVGTDFIDGVSYLINKVYGPSGRRGGQYGEEGGKNELSLDNLEKLLNTLSPHAMLFTEDGEMTLSVIPLSVNIFIFPDSDDSDSFQNEVRRYQAPEAQRRESARTREEAESAAVFALGLLIYEVFTGWVPFNGYSANEACEMMCNGMRPDTAQISQVDSSFSDLIGRCVAQEWSERPKLADVKKKLALYLPASAKDHFDGAGDSGSD